MTLQQFIDASPVSYLAVATLEELLYAAGYRRIDFSYPLPSLAPGDRVFATWGDASLYAFHLGSEPIAETGLRLLAAHADSPTFRVKPHPEMLGEGGHIKLNTEPYGGMIMSTWFDRPLSLAGRVMVRTHDAFRPLTRLVHFKEPMLVIPNLAIHFNREVNRGVALSAQHDMLPVMGCVSDTLSADGLLTRTLAAHLDVAPADILDFDLFLYDTTPACTLGPSHDLITSARLDDLSMVHTAVSALLAQPDTPRATQVLAVFDNEETGSRSKQGAASPLLSLFIERIIAAHNVGLDRSSDARADLLPALLRSFLVSADNAHAWHPNYPAQMDPSNHPLLGHGPIVKVNAAQKYVTDADGAAVFCQLCEEAGVGYQRFVNNSDVAGGSTLGGLLTASLPLRGVDMGCGVWAMHSCRETASLTDHALTRKAFEHFYSA